MAKYKRLIDRLKMAFEKQASVLASVTAVAIGVGFGFSAGINAHKPKKPSKPAVTLESKTASSKADSLTNRQSGYDSVPAGAIQNQKLEKILQYRIASIKGNGKTYHLYFHGGYCSAMIELHDYEKRHAMASTLLPNAESKDIYSEIEHSIQAIINDANSNGAFGHGDSLLINIPVYSGDKNVFKKYRYGPQPVKFETLPAKVQRNYAEVYRQVLDIFYNHIPKQ